MLDKVSKIFGRFAALREVSTSFYPGKLYVLLGDNGAGKSTLLRVISGLAQPSLGRITFFPADVSLGFMSHSSMLYDELSGMENLVYFAQLLGIEDEQVSANAMQAVGLAPELERPVRDYSQGMRQRLSLARTIQNDPHVILLDEPFSNVDSNSTAQMAQLLGVLRDHGRTILVVTHQPDALNEVADEFILLAGGRIVGATAQLDEVLS